MFRSRLLEQLDEIVKKQESIGADVQKLMLFASGDHDLLEQILGGTEQIAKTLDSGVNLSDEAIERIRAAVGQEAANSREVRAIAVPRDGPDGGAARTAGGTPAGTSGRARGGRGARPGPGRAQRRPHARGRPAERGTHRCEPSTPAGFLYKAMAQVFDAMGDSAQEDEYISRAERIFRLVKDDLSADQKTALDVANAIHGLGNVAHAHGDFHAAIDWYQLAVTIYPDHVYAWHDIFVASDELAKQGEVDVDRMRHTLARVKQIDPSAPGLGLAHIAQLDAVLHSYEQEAHSGP